MIRALDTDKYVVTVVDDLSTQRYCSLFDVGRKFDFQERDFADITVTELSRFDTVVHLAAKTDAASSIKEKEETFNVNVTKTIRFINCVREAQVGFFIFPSSTSVYGKGQEVMYENEVNIIPQSPYAESKVLVEEHLKKSGICHIIFRFGTIFGISPGMRFHTAINKFCYQAALEQPLTVWRQNYNQYRPYLGLNDAIGAIDLALSEQLSPNEIYNVLTTNVKLCQIIEMIEESVDVNIKWVDTPLLNQHTYFVNDDKIKAMGLSINDVLSAEIRKTLQLLGGDK